MIDARLAVRGVKEPIGEVLRGQDPAPEPSHFRIEAGADPGHFRLSDLGIRAQRFDQIVDLMGRDSVNAGLHHNAKQALVDAAAPLEHGGEERPGAQLRDLQIRVPGAFNGAAPMNALASASISS